MVFFYIVYLRLTFLGTVELLQHRLVVARPLVDWQLRNLDRLVINHVIAALDQKTSLLLEFDAPDESLFFFFFLS